MLEELQAIALLGLIGTNLFLVRGCFSIKNELPVQGRSITKGLERTSELLDEVAQLIADLGEGTPVPAPMQGSDSPFGLILNSLLNRAPMAQEHGDTTQERTVYETVIHPTQNDTEDQPQ
ncbi:MAG: hypothetical protein ISP83_07135 [Candidatus Poseidonia sp.]|nr:hypothetical protein [Poseidonia sp.]